MIFLFVGITLDVGQVFSLILIPLCYLGGVDPGDWRGSLSIFLTFLGGLGLRLISGREVMGLSLLFIYVGSLIAVLPIDIFLVLFNRQAIAF